MFTPEEIQEWKENRKLSTAQVIERLPEEVKSAAYVVGSWVWIETDRDLPQETVDRIKHLGFKWNKFRGVFQHPCGVFRKQSSRDPREYYGIQELEDEQ
ncbi:MAG: hypothetical protein ONB55_21800 [candidate division KSB1 bacterium]|nr:hypothetical protein [candidate division KSB1 bacterium]